MYLKFWWETTIYPKGVKIVPKNCEVPQNQTNNKKKKSISLLNTYFTVLKTGPLAGNK